MTGLDRINVGIAAHRALLTPMIRLAGFSLAAAATLAAAAVTATEPRRLRHRERQYKGVTMTDRGLGLK
ncbi:hypothetical protein SynA15127_01309 [Synechococcus sp. A15-127]|nr:hypothetical protein SynA15127_01309 [Synechococcus sp. A15-127]